MLVSPAGASADPVLEWNAIAVAVTTGSPFTQARFMAITQLAVFEAVNAVTGKYEPYLGTVDDAPGASAEAAAIAAAYRVLKTYFPANALLDPARANSLAAIPDSAAKTLGVATGEAAAAAMIANRLDDNSAPPPAGLYVPGPSEPGKWQLTPSCTAGGGVFFDRPTVTPFGIPSVDRFMSGPPPALTSRRYTKDYLEVKRVGSIDSTERPQDRTDVARFYAAASPAFVLNTTAQQVAVAQHRSLAHNARALALLNMAISDSLVTSFATKYHYDFWRPETAIRAAATDGNDGTFPDTNFAPLNSHPLFSELSLKPRERELRWGRGAAAHLWGRAPSHHADDDGPGIADDAAIHQIQGDHRRYRRRARLRGDPFPVRSGGGGTAGTRCRRQCLPSQPEARPQSRA
jgi:hypothetical protein